MNYLIVCGAIVVAVFVARGTESGGRPENDQPLIVVGRGIIPPNAPVCEPSPAPPPDDGGQG